MPPSLSIRPFLPRPQVVSVHGTLHPSPAGLAMPLYVVHYSDGSMEEIHVDGDDPALEVSSDEGDNPAGSAAGGIISRINDYLGKYVGSFLATHTNARLLIGLRRIWGSRLTQPLEPLAAFHGAGGRLRDFEKVD